jgi:hypothetical protein
MTAFRFAEPLCEGIIEKRKSQFTMVIQYEGQSGKPRSFGQTLFNEQKQ